MTNRHARLLALAVLLALGACGPGQEAGDPTSPSPAAPSPTTSPRPSPSPGLSRFSSTIHGISIDYPSGWQTRPATEPWGHDAVAFGAPEVDVIFDPTLQDDLHFSLASEPLGGRSGDDWCCSDLWASAEICSNGPSEGGSGGGSSWGAYTLDGAHGYAGSCGSSAEGAHFVTVATATRGYVIRLYLGDERLQATYDWDWFEAALETVDLRPEEALDASSPSESP